MKMAHAPIYRCSSLLDNVDSVTVEVEYAASFLISISRHDKFAFSCKSRHICSKLQLFGVPSRALLHVRILALCRVLYDLRLRIVSRSVQSSVGIAPNLLSNIIGLFLLFNFVGFGFGHLTLGKCVGFQLWMRLSRPGQLIFLWFVSRIRVGPMCSCCVEGHRCGRQRVAGVPAMVVVVCRS